MSERIDTGARLIGADPSAIYRAFAAAEAFVVWVFEAVDGGTLMTVRCADVPARIDPKDHEEGLMSTLGSLAACVERVQ